LCVAVSSFPTRRSSDLGSRLEVTASANWSSSDSSIATVDGAGLATAKAIGTASIGATYNSFTASGQLQVRPEARFVYALNADETDRKSTRLNSSHQIIS